MSRSPIKEVSPLCDYQRLTSAAENSINEIEAEKYLLRMALTNHIEKHGTSSSCKSVILQKCFLVLENPSYQNYNALQSEIKEQKQNLKNYTTSTGFFSRVSETASLVERTVQLLEKMKNSSYSASFSIKK